MDMRRKDSVILMAYIGFPIQHGTVQHSPWLEPGLISAHGDADIRLGDPSAARDLLLRCRRGLLSLEERQDTLQSAHDAICSQ